MSVDEPPRDNEQVVRLIATNDLLSTVVPLRSTYGRTGSIAKVDAFVDRQRQDGPTLWVDSGDFLGGVTSALCDHPPAHAYEAAGIDAACVGNHELDRGVAALKTAAERLPFPLLCADRPIGMADSALVETASGPVGFVGISHPHTDKLSAAPPRSGDWVAATRRTASTLREAGARCVVALCHMGVTWYPTPSGIRHEPPAFEIALDSVADAFDLILGGHTFTGWVGDVAGIPAGQAHGFAGSVLIADLPDDGAPIAPTLARPPEIAVDAEAGIVDDSTARLVRDLDTMDGNIVGELAETHTMPATNGRSLPAFVSDAFLREVHGADAAFVAACELWTQAPLDGVIAALLAGQVSELDVRRLFPHDEPLRLAELGSDEFDRLVEAHDRTTDPANRRSDGVWWNWARFPAGVARRHDDPRRICVSSFGLVLLEELLRRRVAAQPLDVRGSQCVQKSLSR